MAQRVLITGHTGFIGSGLEYAYKELGNTVSGFSKTTNCDIAFANIDVRNYDLIIHCASTVNDYELLSGSSADITTNCLGTHNLLEAVRQQNPWTRLIYVSSFFANGDPPVLPVTEETECYPKGTYGASKLFCENMCRTYASVFGLDITIARLTNVYGPGNNKASSRTSAFNWMLKNLEAGEWVNLYDNGVVKRDYLYIQDAVSGIVSVANYGKRGDVYFVSTGTGISFKEMMTKASEYVVTANIRYVDTPAFHSRIGIRDFWASHDKLTELSGWKPKWSLEKGLQSTIEYYREYHGQSSV